MSVSLPEVRQTVNITGTAAALMMFSNEHTKAELQEELDGRGIEYNARDNKEKLLNKLND